MPCLRKGDNMIVHLSNTMRKKHLDSTVRLQPRSSVRLQPRYWEILFLAIEAPRNHAREG